MGIGINSDWNEWDTTPPAPKVTSYLRVGYRCIQGYPRHICSGCTSACDVPVFIEDDSPLTTKSGRVLIEADIEALAGEAERGYDISQIIEAHLRGEV